MAEPTVTSAPTDGKPSGRRATLALVAGSHAINHAYVPLMPFVWAKMMTEIGLTYTQLGWLTGLTNVVGGVIQMWFGALSRVIQRKVLLGIGNILQGISTALTGGAGNFNQVLWLRMVNRVAASPQHPSGNSIIAEQFERNQTGRALGFNNSMAQVGMVAAPMITAFLMVRFGWRWTLVFFSLPALIIGVLMFFMIREKPRPRNDFKLRNLAISWTDIKSYFRDKNITSITGAQLFAAGGRGIGVVLTYVPLFLIQELKYSTVQAGILVTCLTVASVVGPLAFGLISDKLGRKKVILMTYGLSTLFTIAFALQTSQSFLVPVLLFIMGLVIYAESPLLQSWMSDVTDEKNRDMNFGIYFTIGYGGGAVWGPVIGWLVESRGFTVAFMVMAASYVLGSLCVLPAAEKLAKRSQVA